LDTGPNQLYTLDLGVCMLYVYFVVTSTDFLGIFCFSFGRV